MSLNLQGLNLSHDSGYLHTITAQVKEILPENIIYYSAAHYLKPEDLLPETSTSEKDKLQYVLKNFCNIHYTIVIKIRI